MTRKRLWGIEGGTRRDGRKQKQDPEMGVYVLLCVRYQTSVSMHKIFNVWCFGCIMLSSICCKR